MSTVPVRSDEEKIAPPVSAPPPDPRPPFPLGTRVELRGSSFLTGTVQSCEGDMAKVLMSLPLDASPGVLHIHANALRPLSPLPSGEAVPVSKERFHMLAFSAWINGAVGDLERVRKRLTSRDSALCRAMDKSDREHAGNQLDRAGDILLKAHPSPDCSITTDDFFALLDGKDNPAAFEAVAGLVACTLVPFGGTDGAA